MNRKNVFIFIALAVGISWLSAGIQYLCGIRYGSLLSVILIATTYMYGPALSAIVLGRITKTPSFNYGLRFKRSSLKGWLLTPLVFILFILSILLSVFLPGNIMHLRSFPHLDLSADYVQGVMREMAASRGVPAVIPPWINGGTMLILTIVGGIFAGATINLLATFGEEYGWRGAFLYETRSLGFWKSGILIGTVWGFWHAPIILQGHNYPDHPIAGIFMFVPCCIGMALILSYVRVKSKSVIAAGAFHGMINATAGGLMLVMTPSDTFFSVVGIPMIMGSLLTILLIFLFDRKTIRDYTLILSEEKPHAIPVVAQQLKRESE